MVITYIDSVEKKHSISSFKETRIPDTIQRITWQWTGHVAGEFVNISFSEHRSTADSCHTHSSIPIVMTNNNRIKINPILLGFCPIQS